MIVHHEQIAEWTKRPPHPRVGAEGVRSRVILQETREWQIGRDVEPRACSENALHEAPLRQTSYVTLAVELEREEGGGFPGAGELILSEMPVVNATKPH